MASSSISLSFVSSVSHLPSSVACHAYSVFLVKMIWILRAFARYQTKSRTQPEKQVKLTGNGVKWKEMPGERRESASKEKKREKL